MRNIKLTISYDGTNYKGWQTQPNGNSIQAELEKAIEELFGARHVVHGAGRTDAGVHALAQAAHFKLPGALSIPSEKIADALNSALPEDIVVKESIETEPDFHSRFDATGKVYRYSIFNSDLRDPFLEKYSWRVPYNLNLSLMEKEAEELTGKHDFKSFQASDKRERPSVRNISGIYIKKKGPSIDIQIEGDGFLYNMVRNIVGTLVEIGRGYLPEGSMKKILKNRDRTTAGPTAPSKGLFLVKVRY